MLAHVSATVRHHSPSALVLLIVAMLAPSIGRSQTTCMVRGAPSSSRTIASCRTTSSIWTASRPRRARAAACRRVEKSRRRHDDVIEHTMLPDERGFVGRDPRFVDRIRGRRAQLRTEERVSRWTAGVRRCARRLRLEPAALTFEGVGRQIDDTPLAFVLERAPIDIDTRQKKAGHRVEPLLPIVALLVQRRNLLRPSLAKHRRRERQQRRMRSDLDDAVRAMGVEREKTITKADRFAQMAAPVAWLDDLVGLGDGAGDVRDERQAAARTGAQWRLRVRRRRESGRRAASETRARRSGFDSERRAAVRV